MPSLPEEPLILINSLSKDYQMGGNKIAALRDVNLCVGRGELVVISGPSGSGKTTLLNITGGLDRPTSGRVVVCSEDLGKLDEAGLTDFRRANVGFVFQSYNLISTFTVEENIRFPLELSSWQEVAIGDRVANLLKLVGLSQRAHHLPSQLSSGEQQRVAFARALAKDPQLLLVDEPTANLDERTGMDVVKLIKGLKEEEKTIIAATHDRRLVRLANEVVRILEGRVVEPRGRP